MISFQSISKKEKYNILLMNTETCILSKENFLIKNIENNKLYSLINDYSKAYQEKIHW
jgi:hypothetical protein